MASSGWQLAARSERFCSVAAGATPESRNSPLYYSSPELEGFPVSGPAEPPLKAHGLTGDWCDYSRLGLLYARKMKTASRGIMFRVLRQTASPASRILALIASLNHTFQMWGVVHQEGFLAFWDLRHKAYLV